MGLETIPVEIIKPQRAIITSDMEGLYDQNSCSVTGVRASWQARIASVTRAFRWWVQGYGRSRGLFWVWFRLDAECVVTVDRIIPYLVVVVTGRNDGINSKSGEILRLTRDRYISTWRCLPETIRRCMIHSSSCVRYIKCSM